MLRQQKNNSHKSLKLPYMLIKNASCASVAVWRRTAQKRSEIYVWFDKEHEKNSPSRRSVESKKAFELFAFNIFVIYLFLFWEMGKKNWYVFDNSSENCFNLLKN